MSFDLLGLKKTDHQEKKVVHYQENVVVGEDFFSLLSYLELKEHKPESTTLFCSKEVSERDFFPSYPSFLRGKDDIQFLTHILGPNLSESAMASRPPVFYKDGEWKDFTGRAKPEKLLEMEDFFLGETLFFDLSRFFESLKNPQLVEKINQARQTKEIVAISSTTPSDLVEEDYFHLDLSDGSVLKCKNLIWARAPREFIQILKNKAKLTDDFIEYLEGLSSQMILNMEFYFNDLVLDKEGIETYRTLFVPQSYTHEWGHFICEFKELENSTVLSVLCFNHDDAVSEEEIGKKIRLLKRNVEKVFSDIFSNKKYSEYIRFKQESLCLNIDDLSFQKFKDQLPHLTFASYSAPFGEPDGFGVSFEDSDHKILGLARAIGAYQQQKKSRV